MRQWLEVVPVLQRAVEPRATGDGLVGVAVLSPAGEPVGTAGTLADYEVRALAALVSRAGRPDLLRTLFDGEVAMTTLDGHPLFLGIAARCVFVIAMAIGDAARARAAAGELLADVERLIRDARAQAGARWIPPTGSAGGSSSPAEAFAWPPRPRDPGDKN